MSKLKYILLIFFVLAGFTAYAQDEADQIEVDETNRTEDGKIIRGAYLTNQWYDNWVFGASVGVQTLWSTGNHGLLFTPKYEVSVIKWLTPSIAFGGSFYGFGMKERRTAEYLPSHTQLINENGVNLFRQSFGFDLMAMWNVSNAIFGYKPRRFWSCSPYVKTGFLRLADTNGDGHFFNVEGADRFYKDREFIFGFGVYNTFRISDHFNATLNLSCGGLRTAYHSSQNSTIAYHLSASAGVSYIIHKWYWTRHTTSIAPLKTSYKEAKDALAAAQKESKDLEQKNRELAQKNDKLEKNLNILSEVVANTPAPNEQDELQARISSSPLVVYFDLNSDKLTAGEVIRLEEYVHTTCDKDPYHVFYITGSADEGTGNYTINARLSRARGETVKKFLVGRMHVPVSQVVLKPAIISHKHADERLDRCVFFENE